MVVLFLAAGFEEIEALATVDVLRRADVDVCTVGIGGRTVVGAHGITVVADVADSDWEPFTEVDAVVLPGGMPGTLNLEGSLSVRETVEHAAENGALLCAICAAPSVLGKWGLLRGRSATCYPGFEEYLLGASVKDAAVVADGTVITSRGAGAALEFGFAIVGHLVNAEKADELRAAMQCR